MSECGNLTRTLVSVASAFFVFVIAYSVWQHTMDSGGTLMEGFDVASLKAANASKIKSAGRAKAAAVKQAAAAQHAGTDTGAGAAPGAAPSHDCITQAQCQTQQTANQNAKILQTLSAKIDSLSTKVSNMQAQSRDAIKHKGLSSAKSATAAIPNSPALKAIKAQSSASVDAHAHA